MVVIPRISPRIARAVSTPFEPRGHDSHQHAKRNRNVSANL
jgi:hypothetical protein